MSTVFEAKARRLRNTVEPVAAGVYFARRRTRHTPLNAPPRDAVAAAWLVIVSEER